MQTKAKDRVEFNFHISSELNSQISTLQDAGLSLSAIARLAIRKCGNDSLDEEPEASLPKRVLLYLHPDDAKILESLAAREGDRSRARTLRRLISTFLRSRTSAIAELF